ncbi:MAG TPA: M1 family aminopeptidase, partial [Pirellulaceae bacterium]|nr:M1 family aminopeptidase [Pirellulaceae bacterium]
MQRVVTGSIMGTIIAAIGVGNSMWCVSGAPRANATFAQRIDERIAVRQRVEVSYQMAFDPARQELNVRIDVSGLDPQRDVMAFELPDWGEWTEVDSLYLRLLRGDPPVERDPENPRFFRLKAPEGWNGTPTLTYSIPLVDSNSQLRRRHGLLPWTKTDESGVWTASSYALAFANNTLMSVRVDGQPVETPREVRLSAPESMGIVTGWQGFSEGEQVVVLDHDIDKTPLLFGAPLAHAEATHAGVTYEIYQYSRGDDLTEAILELVQKLVPAYGKHTGRELGKPLRVFVTDTGGGQKTDHGLLLQPWHEADLAPMYKQLIAHELFHEWLGGYVAAGDESLTWFQEGFTDYLALWHLARAGQIGHDWFAQRLSDINDAARTSSAYGQVSFADPTVSWRDWDGPNETLAYRGGTVLALGLDVELRKH